MSEQNRALSSLPTLPTEPAGSAGVDLPGEAPAAARPTASPAVGSLTWLDLLKWAVSFPAMLGMLLIGRIFYEARGFGVDPDMWWHIKVGQDILRTGHWPVVDAYSWTAAGTPWIAYEWLGELPLALVQRIGGRFGGVVALDFFLIALSSIISIFARRVSGIVSVGLNAIAFVNEI